jgi:ribosomal protein S18 acetylase RimI-like enzyme
MIIRPALRPDLRKIGEIHIKAFPKFFMTSLGPKFIVEYYSVVLDYLKKVFLVAEEDGRVLGFIAGFIEPHRFYSNLRRKRIKLGLFALPALLKKPSLIIKIFNNLRRVSEFSSEEKKKCSELASIGVNPKFSGQGLGKSLVNAFLEMSQKLGAEVVYLTTDASDNDKVNQFYLSLGFKLNNTFLAYSNRLMNEYVFYLNQNKDSNQAFLDSTKGGNRR